MPHSHSRSTSRRRRVWRPVQADSATEVSTEGSPRIHDPDEGPRGPDGQRGTGYAFAIATAIRSAQMRRFGRAVEKPCSTSKRNHPRVWLQGGERLHSLGRFCALESICATVSSAEMQQRGFVQADSRLVIASFWLTHAAWRRFSRFFADSPDESLQRRHISAQDRWQRYDERRQSPKSSILSLRAATAERR